MDESRRLQYLSYGLYRKVSDTVGPERVIQIRRTVTNLSNDYDALYSNLADSTAYPHLSGSYAEGFRFRSSDRDIMFVHRHVIVTNNQEHDNHSDDITVLRMETDLCRPGFSLLRLEHVPLSRDFFVTRPCVQLPQGVYVSSSLWKEVNPKVIPNGVIHGPCDSGMVGVNEVDFAYCFRCDTWPESALGCINRLQNVGWPSSPVLNNILKEGCHMVAIGAKGSHFENEEWRVSFSFAEKTLIHNMNHCQFLCYGLLKIFLKEAIENRQTGEKLLCSYFLKTAIFWEICNESTQWSSSAFLQCFWACFRRLLGWVYNGYCPNFFIPENNMFYSKIQGRAQSELLRYLMTLHSEGYNCLLRCQSLQPSLSVIVHQPVVSLFLPTENALYSQSYYAIREICEFIREDPNRIGTWRVTKIAHQTLSLMTHENDELKRLILTIWKRRVTQFLRVHSSLEENNKNNLSNKEKLYDMHSILRTLKSQSFDLLHHNLLSCIYLYRSGFYGVALKVLLLRVKRKLQQPNVMYHWAPNEDNYREAGGEHTPLTAMMKKVVAFTLSLPMGICVPELTMEHQACPYMNNGVYLPPLIIVNFLLYLYYYRQGQFTEANILVEELAVLLAFDEEQHIHPVYRAISWTMLGICQEMSGQLANAYYSYTAALHDQYSYIKDSTRVRIENVLKKINNEYQ